MTLISGGQRYGKTHSLNMQMAAPMLYAACKLAERQLELWMKDYGDDLESLRAITAIQEAVAKADGKS